MCAAAFVRARRTAVDLFSHYRSTRSGKLGELPVASRSEPPPVYLCSVPRRPLPTSPDLRRRRCPSAARNPCIGFPSSRPCSETLTSNFCRTLARSGSCSSEGPPRTEQCRRSPELSAADGCRSNPDRQIEIRWLEANPTRVNRGHTGQL
jgi:hypothetical protein